MQTNSANYMNILQRDQISAAIHDAEKTTNGEIFAVFAKESDNYFFISFFIWTVAIFFTSIIAAYGIHWFWHDVPLHYFASTVLAIHLLGLFYLSILPQLRLLITPAAIKNRICHANAVRQFLAQNINHTKNEQVSCFSSLKPNIMRKLYRISKLSKKYPQKSGLILSMG